MAGYMAASLTLRVSWLTVASSQRCLDTLRAVSSAKQTEPYGSWATPVTSEVVVKQAVRLSDVRVDGRDVIWSEGRPAEGGRTTLVRHNPDGTLTELLPLEANARTTVHEYGGGAWWVSDGVVWYAAWDDQRLYRRDPETGQPTALTPQPELPRGDRYADGDVSPDGQWIACVREHHPRQGSIADVRNEIVRLAAHEPSTPEVLVSGPDFVSDPRWSPDGQLCWLEWDHPNMPWDGTRLHVGDPRGERRLVAGGPDESVSEPRWLPDGSLVFISDRTGWWNLYRWVPESGEVEAQTALEAEIGMPQWLFGLSARYAHLPDGRIVFARIRDGFDGVSVRLQDGEVVDVDVPLTSVYTLRAAEPDSVVVVAASPHSESAVMRIALADQADVAAVETLRAPRDLGQLGVPEDYISVPQAVGFPSAGGRTAYGLLYEPVHPGSEGPDDELPPLLVDVHGGPTAQVVPELDIDIQYWTSRGFAVLCVNYGGSTGFGRRYRDLLRGTWGVVDVDDCLWAARWLAEQGRADPDRCVIRGGSAGGFTTLAALVREDAVFAAGADYFGVADLEALALDTHKFESHYLDRLVGPYPAMRDLYRERSPIEHIDRFATPLIVLQGLKDEVVSPNQATMIVEALKRKGVPVAYLPFAGEQHGFRRAENIRRALDAELSFYGQIFGFELPGEEGIEPVELQ
jgi:dipeptidyl aminopeptidase/acylaminoacyl peptidase